MGAGADAFAAACIADWNRHDLEAILDHYAQDVVFRSPKVWRFTGGQTDQITGRDGLRPYFAAGLAGRPGLTFTLDHAFRDRTGVALQYRAEDGGTACETMTLDDSGRVSQARVFYLSLEGHS